MWEVPSPLPISLLSSNNQGHVLMKLSSPRNKEYKEAMPSYHYPIIAAAVIPGHHRSRMVNCFHYTSKDPTCGFILVSIDWS